VDWNLLVQKQMIYQLSMCNIADSEMVGMELLLSHMLQECNNLKLVRKPQLLI
jgi:hypothetical protein